MKSNYGKKFEEVFKADWANTFPGEFLYRLKDNTSGFRGASANPCDYLALVEGNLFMLETKCHYGNTFPFQDLRQYDLLLTFKGLKNVHQGVVIWYIDHDEVLYVPLDTITMMKADGLKSVNINKLGDYKVIHVPSVKKRVFLKSDYSFIKELINEGKS